MSGWAAREALLLLDLQPVDPPLHVAAALDVEPVPPGLQRVVHLRRGLGDEDEPVRPRRRELPGDDGLPGARAAGEDDATEGPEC